MTKSTLPQPAPACLDLVLDLVRTSSSPLTMHQIRDTIRAEHKFSPTEIRAAVLELVADELLDYEQLRGAPTRVFFLIGRPPYGATWVPQAQWYVPSGLAA